MNDIRLTQREQEVLKLVSEEHSNKEIAQMLFVSVGTIETHRRHLFHKLGARNMAGLIKRAFDHNLLVSASK